MAKPEPFRYPYSMVVYIDEACRNNGSPTARASYGIYFGPSSPYNSYGLLPDTSPQTSTRAEIEALSQALKISREITDQDFQLSHIKVATDLSLLANAMCQWMEQWTENGGMGTNGRQVAHYQFSKQLHEELDYMEYSDDGGKEMQFWHIPSEMNLEMNREADALVNKAVDEA
jgi:ribonuclease HI